jgi:E3 ubiquitin-protein ligase TRIP12
MLLATRACSMIAEHSGSCNALVQHGAIEYMCTKLTAIEYIDLAETSIGALEKLSCNNSRSLLVRNVLQSALTFVDFFSEGIQRVAAKLTVQVCANV